MDQRTEQHRETESWSTPTLKAQAEAKRRVTEAGDPAGRQHEYIVPPIVVLTSRAPRWGQRAELGRFVFASVVFRDGILRQICVLSAMGLIAKRISLNKAAHPRHYYLCWREVRKKQRKRQTERTLVEGA
ncbi:hypothetical protein NDU88_008470 [Pleurodeles waltl]|uniref:Uncharacterized protein n=1 Tax=Pleurodeles waltl TaxID=8319 RepID=A0AAV7QUM3_PLEWA|nr:hypothetical protein NDU88_008470 [Pleurodeles waltl]